MCKRKAFFIAFAFAFFINISQSCFIIKTKGWDHAMIMFWEWILLQRDYFTMWAAQTHCALYNAQCISSRSESFNYDYCAKVFSWKDSSIMHHVNVIRPFCGKWVWSGTMHLYDDFEIWQNLVCCYAWMFISVNKFGGAPRCTVIFKKSFGEMLRSLNKYKDGRKNPKNKKIMGNQPSL